MCCTAPHNHHLDLLYRDIFRIYEQQQHNDINNFEKFAHPLPTCGSKSKSHLFNKLRARAFAYELCSRFSFVVRPSTRTRACTEMNTITFFFRFGDQNACTCTRRRGGGCGVKVAHFLFFVFARNTRFLLLLLRSKSC